METTTYVLQDVVTGRFRPEHYTDFYEAEAVANEDGFLVVRRLDEVQH